VLPTAPSPSRSSVELAVVRRVPTRVQRIALERPRHRRLRPTVAVEEVVDNIHDEILVTWPTRARIEPGRRRRFWAGIATHLEKFGAAGYRTVGGWEDRALVRCGKACPPGFPGPAPRDERLENL
jgi:hypothetical protein